MYLKFIMSEDMVGQTSECVFEEKQEKYLKVVVNFGINNFLKRQNNKNETGESGSRQV